jgi:hypothetical protein
LAKRYFEVNLKNTQAWAFLNPFTDHKKAAEKRLF